MGVISASFHSHETLPRVSPLLNRIEDGLTISSFVSLSNLGETLSGPGGVLSIFILLIASRSIILGYMHCVRISGSQTGGNITVFRG